MIALQLHKVDILQARHARISLLKLRGEGTVFALLIPLLDLSVSAELRKTYPFVRAQRVEGREELLARLKVLTL